MDEVEREVIRPLDALEIKEIITIAMASAIRDSLDKDCLLYGVAYPKFKMTGRIEYTLENFGEERQGFTNINMLTHELKPGAAAPEMTGKPIREDVKREVAVELPYTPPNKLRKEFGLPVPTVVRRDTGETEQKAVIYRRVAPHKAPPAGGAE